MDAALDAWKTTVRKIAVRKQQFKNLTDGTERRLFMERAFKTMTSAGASNIVLGIIMVTVGIATGVITIVNGARLLKHRGEITF
jgi:hypothetical protein